MNESIFFANESRMDDHCDYYDFETWWELVGNFKELPETKKYVITDDDELPF